MANGHGGARPGSGPKPLTPEQKAARKAARSPARAPIAQPSKHPVTLAAQARSPGALNFQAILAAYKEHNAQRIAESAEKTFRPATFPPRAVPKEGVRLAMDENLNWAGAFANSQLGLLASEGLTFLGYPYLSELAQRPEYRVMSETIADDSTRKWIDFEITGTEEDQERARKDPVGEAERMADPDERKKRLVAAGKMDKVKALKEDQERLDVRGKFYENSRDDGFFGRSHLFYDFGSGIQPGNPELKTPIGNGIDALSVSKVKGKKIQRLSVIEPVWVYPTSYNASNPLGADWYNPQCWYVMGTEVHRTRLPAFVGHPVPDLLKPAYAFGGISLSQLAKPYVDIWLTTRESVANLIKSFSVMVLSTDLNALLQAGGNDLLARADLFNLLRDNQGLFLLNEATEDFKNVSASLAGLHELQAQAQEHMASVPRIPIVKFTGLQPAGLNASSEGEIAVYDDTIAAYQQRFHRPELTRLIHFEQLGLFGEVDPQITFVFEPLRELTAKEIAEKQKIEAERDDVYINMGAIAPEEVRRRVIDDSELPYADLDPDDVPDLAEEEEQGLMPGGKQPGSEGVQGGEAANDGAIPFDVVVDLAKDAGFNESDHPRDNDGKFGEKGGGGGAALQKVFPELKAHHANPAFHQSMVNRLNERVIAAGGKKLDADEYDVMRQYMGYGSGAINGPLLGTALNTADHRAVAKVMDSALKKLPTYKGTSTRVMAIPEREMEAFVAKMKPGATVASPAFVSAAAGDKPAKGFKGNVTMTMKSNGAARNFSMMSAFGGSEREVIFPRGTEFTVESQKKTKTGVHLVLVEKAGQKSANDEAIRIIEIAPDVFVLANDEAAFEESKHPRDNGGKFASTPGGGGSAVSAGSSSKESAAPTSFKSKKDHVAHLLERGTTASEILKTTGWPSVSVPAQARAARMHLAKEKRDGVTYYVGTPMTPEEIAKFYPPAVRNAQKAGRGPAGRPEETWSLTEYLAGNGGIKESDPLVSDLRVALGKKNLFIPGFGMLIRKDGKPMDQAREGAVLTGYLQDAAGERQVTESTINHLLDAIDTEMRGQKQYRMGYEPPPDRDQILDQLEQHLDDELEKADIPAKYVGGKIRKRTLEIMEKEGVSDPLDAYERAVMEQTEDGAQSGEFERIPDDIPYWDVPDDREATP